MRIDHDMHMHTYLSGCCSEKESHRPANILLEAEKVGLKTVGFADHVWDMEEGRRDIAQLREDLSKVSTDIRILVGCEADTLAPGRFTISEEFASDLDFVLMPCNHFHITDMIENPTDVTPRGIAEHMLKFFRSAATSGLTTIIPHCFQSYGYNEFCDSSIAAISDQEFVDAFGLASERNVGIEITLGFFPKAEGDFGWVHSSIETPLRYLSLAKEAGCKFTFASDAHSLGKIRHLPELSFFVKNLGLVEKDIFDIGALGK